MSTAIPVDDPAVSSATTTVAEDVDEDGSFTAAVSKLRSATVHENESLPLEYQSPDPAHTSIPQLEDVSAGQNRKKERSGISTDTHKGETMPKRGQN